MQAEMSYSPSTSLQSTMHHAVDPPRIHASCQWHHMQLHKTAINAACSHAEYAVHQIAPSLGTKPLMQQRRHSNKFSVQSCKDTAKTQTHSSTFDYGHQLPPRARDVSVASGIYPHRTLSVWTARHVDVLQGRMLVLQPPHPLNSKNVTHKQSGILTRTECQRESWSSTQMNHVRIRRAVCNLCMLLSNHLAPRDGAGQSALANRKRPHVRSS